MTRQEFDLVVSRLEVLFESPCPTWLKEERWEVWKNRSKENLLDSIIIDPELNKKHDESFRVDPLFDQI